MPPTETHVQASCGGKALQVTGVRAWRPPTGTVVHRPIGMSTLPPDQVRHLMSDKPLRRYDPKTAR